MQIRISGSNIIINKLDFQTCISCYKFIHNDIIIIFKGKRKLIRNNSYLMRTEPVIKK